MLPRLFVHIMCNGNSRLAVTIMKSKYLYRKSLLVGPTGAQWLVFLNSLQK